ncbi:MAG TPA: malto-oligosyltrehalose synthase [Candidatus Obscuribacterales bacterium]
MPVEATESVTIAQPELTPLQLLAALHGIDYRWTNTGGEWRYVDEGALTALLAECGVQAGSDAEINNALLAKASRVLEHSYAITASSTPSTISITIPPKTARVRFHISEEFGYGHDFELSKEEMNAESEVLQIGGDIYRKINVTLPAISTPGYHDLSVMITFADQRSHSESALLITAPEKAYLCDALEKGEWLWASSLDLSKLSSRRSWGCADFTDLKDMTTWVSSQGGGMLMLDIIHATDAAVKANGLKYASGAMFVDPLFLDVEHISDFHECEEIKRKLLSPAVQERLESFRENSIAKQDETLAEKLQALEELFQHFCHHHLNRGSQREGQFADFCHRMGERLTQFALFCALREAFGSNWLNWPECYRKRNSKEVQHFARNNAERILFFKYVQWQADLQLGEAGVHCFFRHMPVGLCLSYNGTRAASAAEVWTNPDDFATNARLGEAPSDNGQGSISAAVPLKPERLRQRRFASLIAEISWCMHHAGALRIDPNLLRPAHYWIMEGEKPASGTFVHFPLEEVVAILKLESHRHKCVVLADEFVPSNFVFTRSLINGGQSSETVLTLKSMPALSALSFAQDPHCSFTEYWLGQDLTLAVADQEMDKETRNRLIEQRVLQRIEILKLLEEENLLPEGMTTDPASAQQAGSADLIAAIYSLLSGAPSVILIVSIEDIMRADAQQPANDLTKLKESDNVKSLLERIRDKRGAYHHFLLQEAENKTRRACIIPHASYRLQFNKDFTIAQARELIPYLAKLGISHVYASPILVARPGSLHGYDIIDHKRINPEIGTEEEFDAFVSELRAHGMGLILDVVPNHMGIGKDNPWWTDVLENGPASEYADFFDIDWAPVKKELYGKVLLPVLGEAYGKILESGQLQLHFDESRGKMSLKYFEHEFPLNPVSYPLVLGRRLEVLSERLGKDSPDVLEYLSILAALERLPGHLEPVGFADRIREKDVQLSRLSSLCARNPAIGEFIGQNVSEFHVRPDDRPSMERLHSLLEAQAYRLAYWRVAADEINYRRFFDINDLAALRTEDPRVFAEIHNLILKWIKEKKVDGLRIDHVDGLFDPPAYVDNLQKAAAESLGVEYDRAVAAQPESLPLYVVVEKILQPFEHVEDGLAVHGTTGYDFLNSVNDLLVMSRNEKEFNGLYEEFLGHTANYEQWKSQCKSAILDGALSSELNMLAHHLSRIAESTWSFRDFTLTALRNALRQILIEFPVYRTYNAVDRVPKTARQFIEWAITVAKRHHSLPHDYLYDFVRDVLLMERLEQHAWTNSSESPGRLQKDVQQFSMKFQQFTGPVMAKSVEDTLFYRYNRFVGLNEVGGEPKRFGASAAAFHHKNLQRQKYRPYELLSTSTHDTKRSEDVRARLAVLSELPRTWRSKVEFWQRNRIKKTVVNGEPAPDNNDEYLIYQSLIGAAPLDLSSTEAIDNFRLRIEQYMVKAAREAKRHTSWVNTNEAYEEALIGFVRKLLACSSTNPFLEDFVHFHGIVARLGALNALIQAFMKLTSPGVPDIYQGCELWDFSLVDPDNRRPVDFESRKQLIERLEPYLSLLRSDAITNGELQKHKHLLRSLQSTWQDGRIKQFVTAAVLAQRWRSPSLFTKGNYYPLDVSGDKQQHVIAFARKHEDQWAVVVAPLGVPTLLAADQPHAHSSSDSLTIDANIWRDTTVSLPDQLGTQELRNVLTWQTLQGHKLWVADLLRDFPLALLRPIETEGKQS